MCARVMAANCRRLWLLYPRLGGNISFAKSSQASTIKIGLVKLMQHDASRSAAEHLDKNILIYRNDGFRFYRMVGGFALAQIGFWSFLTYSAMTSMTDSRKFELVRYGPGGAPADKKNWSSLSGIRMKLHSGVWRYALTAVCVGIGGLIFSCALFYSKRSIHRIVLRSGGERVTISTFGFFGSTYSFTTPINRVSCQYSRHSARRQLPIKIKDHRFFYIMDMDGRLYNAPLFDRSVGMKRMFATVTGTYNQGVTSTQMLSYKD